MDKKRKAFTKPNEIRIKLKTDTLTKEKRSATFYFGHEVISKFFTKKELQEGARVLVSVINSSILIEKAKNNEGVKLFLQGSGTLGIYKIQSSLHGKLINRLTEFKVKDFEITKSINFPSIPLVIRIDLDCSELDVKSMQQAIAKTSEDVKNPTKKELAPIGSEMGKKVAQEVKITITKEETDFILKREITLLKGSIDELYKLFNKLQDQSTPYAFEFEELKVIAQKVARETVFKMAKTKELVISEHPILKKLIKFLEEKEKEKEGKTFLHALKKFFS